MNDTEEFLDLVSHNFFNKGKWRRLDPKGHSITKGKLMEAIVVMQKHGIEDSLITEILADTFNNAYVEHELQVKEGTGFSTKEFFTAKAKAAGITISVKDLDAMAVPEVKEPIATV